MERSEGAERLDGPADDDDGRGSGEARVVVEDEEVRNPDISEDDLRAEHGGWLGPNPYYLMIILALGPGESSQSVAEIDLDQNDWATFYARFMRRPGQWYLARKDSRVIVATMVVREGEQPYYVAKHVGFTSTGGDGGPRGETTNYGIGKKRLDGHVDRIWIMANGCVTLGDDVEPISLDLLKSGML
jgi:hypothetical protein